MLLGWLEVHFTPYTDSHNVGYVDFLYHHAEAGINPAKEHQHNASWLDILESTMKVCAYTVVA